MGEGSTKRDYRGVEGAVEDAEKGKAQEGAPDEYRRNPRGRTGTSRPKSPRQGVRYVDPESAREGSEGEKAYGPPPTPPPSGKKSERERQAQPDPLKKK